MADTDGLALGAALGVERLNTCWGSSGVLGQRGEVGAQLMWEMQREP